MSSIFSRNAEGLALETRVRVPSELSRDEQRQMLALMTDYYQQVDARQFAVDLLEKEWVIVTSEPTRGVLGFTTLMRLHTEVDGEPIEALFSGDTVLAPEIWGANSWARAWGRHAGSLMRDRPDKPLYWLLLTATHRTYRFLPAFLHEFYPRAGTATPDVFQRRLEALINLKFAGQFDRASGVVRGVKPLAVRDGRTEMAQSGLDDDIGQFFAARNPGHLQGDYLVCLADLSAANRTRLGVRFFAQENP